MKFYILSSLLLAFSSAQSSFSSGSYEPQLKKQFPQATLNSFFQSSGSFVQANEATFTTIKKAKGTIITPTRSIDSLFLRLPSSNELQELALSADSVGLLKTIQVVATDDSLTCEQRISYLLQVVGRIRVAAQKKQYAADQLKVIIEETQKQIRRLSKEIERLQDAKKALWLDEMKEKLKKLLKELENTYMQFNFAEYHIPIKQARILGFEKDLSKIAKKSDGERNRIVQDKIKLVEVQAIIKDLQNQLKYAKIREKELQESVKKSEEILQANYKEMDQIRLQIQGLQKQIKELKDRIDNFRRNFTNLQIEVERLRNDIRYGEVREDKINSQIDVLQDKIDFESSKLANDELDDLNQMIENLNQLIPTISKQIDRHYYYCYGQGSVQVEKTGSVTVYIIKGQSFGNYLHNAYGKSIEIPSIESDVKLQKVDIFGPVWTSYYGYPFPQHSLKGDFNCLNPSSLEKGYGVIESVRNDYLQVKNSDGRRLKFKLGSCSRLESTQEIPKAGQHFFYSAVQSYNEYRLYSGSCL